MLASDGGGAGTVFIAGGDFKGGWAGTLAQLRAVTSIAVNFVIVCGHTGMLATGSACPCCLRKSISFSLE